MYIGFCTWKYIILGFFEQGSLHECKGQRSFEVGVGGQRFSVGFKKVFLGLPSGYGRPWPLLDPSPKKLNWDALSYRPAVSCHVDDTSTQSHFALLSTQEMSPPTRP